MKEDLLKRKSELEAELAQVKSELEIKFKTELAEARTKIAFHTSQLDFHLEKAKDHLALANELASEFNLPSIDGEELGLIQTENHNEDTSWHDWQSSSLCW